MKFKIVKFLFSLRTQESLTLVGNIIAAVKALAWLAKLAVRFAFFRSSSRTLFDVAALAAVAPGRLGWINFNRWSQRGVALGEPKELLQAVNGFFNFKKCYFHFYRLFSEKKKLVNF